MKDSGGVEILPTDTVMVTAWGYGARKYDVRVTSPVHGFGRSRVLITDDDGRTRFVGARVVSVLRRDGKPGFEHNAGRAS